MYSLKTIISLQINAKFLLYFWASFTDASFRHLAFEFRLGRETISKIIYCTCVAIIEEFETEYIPETKESLKNVADKYLNLWKFPDCIGAIYGRHCELKCVPFRIYLFQLS